MYASATQYYMNDPRAHKGGIPNEVALFEDAGWESNQQCWY